MTRKGEAVKAIVHVRQSWVETTGISSLFRSTNVGLGPQDILGIPVTQLDISDNHFVEFTFFPRALENEPFKSVKILVPKDAITLILELKSPSGADALGYKMGTSEM